MLRWLYLALLGAHPGGFRRRFRDEMLEAFDLTTAPREHLWLISDGAVSVFRQWILRSDADYSWQPAHAGGSPLPPNIFHQIEPYKPNRTALIQGGLVAVLLLFGIVNAINRGGGHLRSMPIGMQRPGFGLIKLDRDAFEGKPAIAAERAKDEDDPLRAFLRSYARVMPVVSALDADGDLVLSAGELARAPEALRTLDTNGDGKLSAEECGFRPPADFHGTPAELDQLRDAFLDSNPVLHALNPANHEISAAIADSAQALLALDLDHNGVLTPYELLPNPATSQAAAMFGRFDLHDAGVIGVVPKDDPDADAMRRILTSADRNHDGVITRGELIVELAGRPFYSGSQSRP